MLRQIHGPMPTCPGPAALSATEQTFHAENSQSLQKQDFANKRFWRHVEIERHQREY